MGNSVPAPGQRTVLVSRDADLAAYDALPAPIREAIRHQPDELNVQPILRAWLNPDFMPDLDCIDRLDAFVAKIWSGQ